ncbi:MFS transporter [Herbiconiux sp.]|uniref:MFS transporter n=1 Tax=Herbiconiux sp. TaxID=1871186 RepID=UPI0025BF3495|nr:MFS transporter [Herbiconiux sp.]
MPNSVIDIRERLDQSPMRGAQFGIIAVCVVLNMLDGFDVLAMAFTASAIAEDWALGGAELGILLSAALLGMAIGSTALSSIADAVGRRTTILGCAVVIALGMLVSALAPSYGVLLAMRLVTGLGIGVMQASLNVYVSEYSSKRRRSLAISFYTMGQPIGGTLGGIVIAALIGPLGWHSAFAFGAIATTVMIPLIFWLLPESIDFLLVKRPPNALDTLNRILRRLGHSTVPALPPLDAAANTARGRWAALFSRANRTKTVLLSVAFFAIMGSFYFANSWTPRLVASNGFTAQDGITAGVMFSVGGIIDTLAFGIVSTKAGVVRTLLVTFLLGAGGFAGYAIAVNGLSTAFLAAALLGLLLSAGIAGMFIVGPTHYAAELRATAVGFIIGMGRVGAILSPIVAGALIDRDWKPEDLYFLFIIPMVVGALAIAGVGRHDRRQVGSADAGTPSPRGGVAAR